MLQNMASIVTYSWNSMTSYVKSSCVVGRNLTLNRVQSLQLPKVISVQLFSWIVDQTVMLKLCCLICDFIFLFALCMQNVVDISRLSLFVCKVALNSKNDSSSNLSMFCGICVTRIKVLARWLQLF